MRVDGLSLKIYVGSLINAIISSAFSTVIARSYYCSESRLNYCIKLPTYIFREVMTLLHTSGNSFLNYGVYVLAKTRRYGAYTSASFLWS